MEYTELFRAIKIFATRSKQAQEVQQQGTTELFFDNATNQQNYATTIQNPDGDVAKFLLGWSAKNNKPASFSLQAFADNGIANWNLTINPPALKNAIAGLLDKEFQKMFKQTMNDRLKTVLVAVKNGAGSGSVSVASLSAEI